MKLLVDSSFLIYCAEKGRDFISLAEQTLGEKLECYVLEEVLAELRKLASKKGKRGALARVGLRIAEKMKVVRSSLPEDVNTDQKLLEESKKLKMVLATVDGGLINEAREQGLPILTVKKDQSILFMGVVD